MKKIKNIIFVISILIIILLILLVYYKRKDENVLLQEEIIEISNKNDGQDETSLYGIVSKIVDNTEYYTIKAIAEKYIYLISSDNKISALNLISPKCKTELDINENNINEKTGIQIIENGFDYYILNIKSMYSILEEYNTIYFINGNYKSSEKEDNYDLNLMIAIDNNNKTFDIYTEEYMRKHNYINIETNSNVEFNSSVIENRKFNIYEIKNITERDMANNYFNDFKNKVLTTSAEELHDKIINKEYATKRFETLEEFKNYLSDKKNTFISMKIDKYQIDKAERYLDYVCSDQYGNYYIFRQEDSVMDYTVILDTHTLENKRFTEEYSKANDEKKVTMNIGKFIDMINSADYKAAYQQLDNTFIQNNFSTIDKFKDYVKNYFFEYNHIEGINIKLESNVYVCKVQITDKTKKSNENKNLEVIMKLETDQDFVMSFNMQ